MCYILTVKLSGCVLMLKDDGAWHLPEAPAGYSTDRPMCPFFSKVGVCRFGDR